MSEVVNCAKCGAAMGPGVTICTTCGAETSARSGAAPKKSTKASLSLVSAVLSIVILPFLLLFPPVILASLLAALAAVILARLAKRDIERSNGALKGRGMATAGKIIGGLSPLVLILALVIPNLMAARSSPGESGYYGEARHINTVEVNYATEYPLQGFAPDLATLGPGMPTPGKTDSDCNRAHACLLDAPLGGPYCTAGRWCEKLGFRYSVAGLCEKGVCSDYVMTATRNERGGYYDSNLCSTSDGVIRKQKGDPLVVPLATPAQCKAWQPI